MFFKNKDKRKKEDELETDDNHWDPSKCIAVINFSNYVTKEELKILREKLHKKLNEFLNEEKDPSSIDLLKAEITEKDNTINLLHDILNDKLTLISKKIETLEVDLYSLISNTYMDLRNLISPKRTFGKTHSKEEVERRRAAYPLTNFPDGVSGEGALGLRTPGTNLGLGTSTPTYDLELNKVPYSKEETERIKRERESASYSNFPGGIILDTSLKKSVLLLLKRDKKSSRIQIFNELAERRVNPFTKDELSTALWLLKKEGKIENPTRGIWKIKE